MSFDAITLVGKSNIALRVVTKNVPAVNEGWNSISAQVFPTSKLILIRASHYTGEKVVHLTYFCEGGRVRTNNVPIDFKFNEYKTSKVLFAAYEKHMLDNLENELSHSFKVGSDPEIFVEDQDGVVIPAFTFLGSKAKPNLSGPVTHGNLPVYWDGFQAEFETSPQNCLSWQVDSVQAGLKAVLFNARKVNKHARLSVKPVMDIPHDMLNEATEEHVSFGCMPSLNAYGLEGKRLPGREVPFRSAGGHIHFGVGTLKPEEATNIVKALDAILGVACVSLFAKYDNPKRRELYGLPGEYRLPPHGLEYRTLSNAWLSHPLIMNLVFDLSRKALVFGRRGFMKHWKTSEEETIRVIRSCDVAGARAILNTNRAIMIKLLSACYGRDLKRVMAAFNIFMDGIESVVKDPSDIATNWCIDGTWITHSDGANKSFNKASAAITLGEKVA